MNTASIVAGLLGIVLIGAAITYFLTPANSLPAFLPGYDPNLATMHYKHGVGALVVGVALLGYVWFASRKGD
jgi:hypothetical protein